MKEDTALERARKNLADAENYLRIMIEVRKDAEYREKVARNLRNEAEAELVRTEARAELAKK